MRPLFSNVSAPGMVSFRRPAPEARSTAQAVKVLPFAVVALKDVLPDSSVIF